MNPELQFQKDLADKHKYKKLNIALSQQVQQRYFSNIPQEIHLEGADDKLYTRSGTLIASSYSRVVVGDYGAFIEIPEDKIVLDKIIVKKGEEYRYESRYKSCKYYWLTVDDYSEIKIYHQKFTVAYADYQPNNYYVSPYQISTTEHRMADEEDIRSVQKAFLQMDTLL